MKKTVLGYRDRSSELQGTLVADDSAASHRPGVVLFPDARGIGTHAVARAGEDALIRIDRDGRERQRINVPGRRGIACALGDAGRRTLFCISAATSPEELRQGKSSARIDVVEVETPGSGYP
ncbi:hypothetical protein QA640_11805 [Bradyrhizobium sp. CB82]|uniref:hypothetical protein n=1 Tax=Bradyrhizobium sp. CB82 TaxID=3039159 RepID=UPI0024B132DD|nr:hypothetical protein [Bradyrhizobium sp. CB82]WFU43067.1 hypothetical protein QA640_11805 [Bradyrhizobium sp. CB82]